MFRIVSDKNLEVKIQEALRLYKERNPDKTPNVIFVNCGELPEAGVICGVMVKPSPSVMPNYFWVGFENGYKPMVYTGGIQ